MSNGRKDVPQVNSKNLRPPYLDYKYFVDSAQHPFLHDAKRFEMVNAWWLSEAATLVYAEPDLVIRTFREKAGLPVVQSFSSQGTECFVASNSDFAIVAFRGTETTPRTSAPRDFADIFRDLLIDFDIIPTRLGQGGKVHHGFQKAVDDVWLDHDGTEGIASYLSRLDSDGRARTIWVTGHSLGAALATLAAQRCDRLHGLYTFGSPRVGDEGFAESFRQLIKGKFGIEYYRFVNDKDIVTTVPPQGFYRHVGSLKHIGSDGGIRDDPTFFARLAQHFRSLLTMPFDSLGRIKPGFLSLIPEGLADHVPTLYAVHIWNAHVEQLGH
jgi:hypothetical protein